MGTNTIADLDLFLRLLARTLITEDINCNSNYMLQVIPCQQMSFILQDESIYLVMDHVGGHGKEEAIGEYTR